MPKKPVKQPTIPAPQPRLLSVDKIVEIVNQHKPLRHFINTFMSAKPTSHAEIFTAADYQVMINSPISNVFQRALFAAITKMDMLKEEIKLQARSYLQNLEIKKAIKKAQQYVDEASHEDELAMRPEKERPVPRLQLPKISVKAGLFATTLQLLIEKLMTAKFKLRMARRQYANILREYQTLVETHHQEYDTFSTRYQLTLKPVQLCQLQYFYTMYHAQDTPEYRQQVVHNFTTLTPKPTPSHTSQEELEARVHRFFSVDYQQDQQLQRLAHIHADFSERLMNNMQAVIDGQQATLTARSGLNQAYQEMMRQHPIAEADEMERQYLRPVPTPFKIY